MLEGFKARLDRLFRERGGGTADPRAVAAALREALVEARAGITTMREALAASERELAAEQKQLADAERRGRLAAAIPDQETVTVAERFAAATASESRCWSGSWWCSGTSSRWRSGRSRR